MVANLIIGSEGFVGKPFCSYLEKLGEGVVRFDIKRDDDEDARQAQLNLGNIDRVYFLAWDVGGSKYLYRDDTQLGQLDWNLRLLLNVMRQLQENPKPFLFVSSQLAEQYDTVYGVTKRLGEIWTHLLNGVRVRLWNVYGPVEPTTERSHVVSDFILQAVRHGEIKMLTTGEETRQFIHIEDVCSALHHGISGGYPGVYDVTSFEWVSIREVAETIGVLTGAKVNPGTVVGSTPLTPLQGKMPGWLPQISLEVGLQKMIDQVKGLTVATHA